MADPSGADAAAAPRIKRRQNAAERRFRAYGIAAILFGLAFLVVLFTHASSSRAIRAFVQSSLKLERLSRSAP